MIPRDLDPRMRKAAAALMGFARHFGIPIQITQGRRSRSQQRRLYGRFKAGRATFPVAPPGTSTHEKGIAVDLIVPGKKVTPAHASPELKFLGELWESWGYTWGGRFKDPIHFDLRARR